MTATDDYIAVALAFGRALVARDYGEAFALTASEYQRRRTLEQMRDAFEALVPADWGTASAVDAGHTMTDWPGKQGADVGWVYVSIGGDVYSEAITIVVGRDDGSLKVRDVEFGRP